VHLDRVTQTGNSGGRGDSPLTYRRYRRIEHCSAEPCRPGL